MKKLGAVFWLGLVFASGFATYMVKYAVQNIDDQLTHVRRQTVAEQQEIRVLNAEWTYLNAPERLAELNQRFLQLAPITPKQLQQKIENIPLQPPPAAAPDTVVAAVTPPPAASAALQPAAPHRVVPQAVAPAPTQAGAATVTSAATPAADVERTSRPPLTIAALSRDVAREPLPVRVATAEATPVPASLDALIARIAEKP